MFAGGNVCERTFVKGDGGEKVGDLQGNRTNTIYLSQV